MKMFAPFFVSDIKAGSFVIVISAWKVPVFELLMVRVSQIWTGYQDLQSKSPYSLRMWENTDQKNSENWYFLRSGTPNLKYILSSKEIKLSPSTSNFFLKNWIYNRCVCVSVWYDDFLQTHNK